MADEKKAQDTAAKKKDDKEVVEEELSEEDAALKEKLELLAQRSMDPDRGVQHLALETIRSEVRSATSSMTSVPKPLKFLRDHYTVLKQYFATIPPKRVAMAKNRTLLADILSVLAMTMAEEGSRESLHFKLQGTKEAPQLWGHEYVRSLCGEIGKEYQARAEAALASYNGNPPLVDGVPNPEFDEDDLMALVDEIVPFLIASNAESEACDLLMEVESVGRLLRYVDGTHYARVCLYLESCSFYLPESDAIRVLYAALRLYRKADRLLEAARVALRVGDHAMVNEVLERADPLVKKQLCLDLARHSVSQNFLDLEDDELLALAGNSRLSQHFQKLAKDLEVMEAKTPEDIYKTHLIDARAAVQGAATDSARQNLAATFVNAFVNMGFAQDKVMSEDETRWIFKNKDHGMMCAAASVGMIFAWDIYGGLAKLDPYLYTEEPHVKAGALMGVGIVSANIRNEHDPGLAILGETLDDQNAHPLHRKGAIAGLGLAYAGTARDEVLEMLTPIVADRDSPTDAAALAALSLGLVYVGSANEELAGTLIQAMSERGQDSAMSHEPLVLQLVPLSLGLLFLGKAEYADAVCESVRALISGPLGSVCLTTLEACAYAGTGNVLKVQHLLGICGQHSEGEDGSGATGPSAPSATPATTTPSGSAAGTGDASSAAQNDTVMEDADARVGEETSIALQQAIATLGIAMIAMGEELGSTMCFRAFDHLLQYGEPQVRRAVPLGLAMLSISHPRINIMDTLSKLSHDTDQEVAQAAILGLGFIGGGTNNSRVANLLRQLSAYYAKDAPLLFVVRVAQGLLHAGKGLITMNPYHAERTLLNPVALGGILTVMFSALDVRGTILGKSSFLLYYLSLACNPRMVYIVDENLEPLSIPVRVGQAVDTVGQAGRPKTITGFQTHTAPVLLSAGERAELATEEYISVSPVIEGCVIVKKNPDYVATEK